MSDDLPDSDHTTPHGVSDATVAALGQLSEALETCERARGHLYGFHQLTGTADIQLGNAIEALREAEHGSVADRIETELLGRNIIPGRWTFQLVEEYDDSYWQLFRDLEQEAREKLAGGRRHLHEARMKQHERSPDHRGHEATPDHLPSAQPAGRSDERGQ